MAKISIITPTYNSSKFIKRTIQSVIDQSYTDWEYLIVDDGSTDNTVELINEYIKKETRIKFFKTQENSGGPALPKNIGIKNATGEYVAFLDHDDEWYIEKLQKQLDIFNSNKNSKLGIVACYVNIKDNDTNKLISKRNNYYRGNIIKELTNNNFLFTSSCVMTKLSILKEAGPFDSTFKVIEDWDMWIRISELGYDFDFVPEYLLNYLVHSKNIYFGNKNFNGENEFIAFCTKHKELLIKNSSLRLGYYYWLTKEYKLSRKYLLRILINKNSDRREKIKSLGCLIISFFPFLKTISQKIWAKIRVLFQK